MIIYIYESKSDVCLKDEWHAEMYDTNNKEKIYEKEMVLIEIEKMEMFNNLVDINLQYKRKYFENIYYIRHRLPQDKNIRRKFNSKYNYGYRIFYLENEEIRFNEILRQTIEIEYESGYTIDIGTRTLEFLNTEEFIHRIELYEKYYSEKKLEIASKLYTIVVDSELTGLLIHELIGHNFEFDIWSKSEYLQNILIPGTKITNEIVNIVDNPKLYNGYGSYEYDDEGNKAFKTYLIKNGVVSDFLRSEKYTYNKYKSCNARRISASETALVRMSNTYMLQGTDSIDSIIHKIKEGIFFKGSGDCVCEKITEVFPREAYLILNGKIVGALPAGKFYITLPDFFNKIASVSKELKLYGGGFGGCGKYDQWPLEIGSGGPYIQINKIYCDFRKRGKRKQ